MSSLIFDWETTGKWVRGKDYTYAGQPKPVQLGAMLIDDAWNEVSSVNLIVLPDGWEIPKEAAGIHGIDTDKAERFGVPMLNVIRVLNGMIEAADNVVAHNLEFDSNITQHAYHYLGLNFDPFEGKESRCTMLVAKRMLKLPNRNPAINDLYKLPRLEECVKHFFDETLENAHDAMVDVRATARVYRYICEQSGLSP